MVQCDEPERTKGRKMRRYSVYVDDDAADVGGGRGVSAADGAAMGGR